METQRILPFTIRYGPRFASGFILFIIVSGWQTFYDAFYTHPIVFRGLSGLKVPLLYVETVIVLGASLVLGVGASFIFWMMKHGEDVDGQLSE